MPYSKKEQAKWMREHRAEKKRVSLENQRELERHLRADAALLRWQARTIEGLQKQVVRMHSLLAARPTIQDAGPIYQQEPTYKVIKEAAWTPLERTEAGEQRIMALEADLARLEAMLTAEEARHGD